MELEVITMTPPADDGLQDVRHRREALGGAADDYEALLARPATSPQWTAGVAQATHQLLAAFDDHIHEVEADDGLLPQLLGDEPRLANTIQRMYDEHVSITADLTAVEQLVIDCGDACDIDAVTKIRQQALEVLMAISVHRQAGADLIWNAYNVDIGGG